MAFDTKDRILDAAERLFAERGVQAASLRDITAEAGVNVASVHYHFGSKLALLAAVLDRRLRPINRQRLDLLHTAEAAAGDRPPALEAVIRAFLAPPFHAGREWIDGRQPFLRLVGRIHGETHDEFRTVFVQQFDEVFRRFTAALRRALPHLDDANVQWRMLFLVGSMAFTMSWGPTLGARGAVARQNPEAILESLVLYSAAGMAAPAGALAAAEASGR